jgi:hypothetical protein
MILSTPRTVQGALMARTDGAKQIIAEAFSSCSVNEALSHFVTAFGQHAAVSY